MTDARLKTMIANAIALDREVAEKTEQLKQVKRELIDEAITRPDEHRPTGGGGKTWEASDASGSLARVTWPSPSLKSAIDAEKPAGAKLMALVVGVKGAKEALFTPVLRYAPVDNFRDRVHELFTGAPARRIIAACETETPPKVSFETKE